MDKKYKLVNINTEEEHLCDKVTIDGFDYYVSDIEPKDKDMVLHKNGTIGVLTTALAIALVEGTNEGSYVDECKHIIATNNPNIDIYKVVNNCMLIEKLANELTSHLIFPEERREGIILGYNKSQETRHFSLDDVKEIFKIAQMKKDYGDYMPYTFEEVIQLWKEQKPKIIYYE